MSAAARHSATEVVRDDDPRREALEAAGWTVVATSFGAELTAHGADVVRLRGLVGAVAPLEVRPLDEGDVEAVLDLDARTAEDYPGGPATAHTPLTRSTASARGARRSFGAFDDGVLVAMTIVDRDGDVVETDRTVVAPSHRRRGLASAVKAASVLAMLDDGARRFRTGGSADNTGILAASARSGYVVDERWLTYAAPDVG
ncbi:GNAT family N-acetyltransferase [Isoptericola jiangsuensis]|uniref:GNAT family N-acetyltransferase n=1 Tax=Isoptericola jiangsuensis TaxID=548579 RepID=UPI003AACFD0E